LWKQEYIQEGISIGEAKAEVKGLVMALQDYLETRFGALSPELRSRIVSNSDAQSLRELTRSAYRAESLERFMEELRKIIH